MNTFGSKVGLSNIVDPLVEASTAAQDIVNAETPVKKLEAAARFGNKSIQAFWNATPIGQLSGAAIGTAVKETGNEENFNKAIGSVGRFIGTGLEKTGMAKEDADQLGATLGETLNNLFMLKGGKIISKM